MLKPLLKHEQHGHHDQSHVSMPRLPLPGLMLRHPDMTFDILKSSLDPGALRLHTRQLYDTRLAGALLRLYFSPSELF